MRAILFATLIALICSLVGTPLAVRYFTRRGYGQEIREELGQTHQVKRGTPTMGGAVIVLSTLIAYFLTKALTVKAPTSSALLVLFLMTGLGAVGFVDDFIKIYRARSLGLRAKAKLAGQTVVTLAFALLALHFPNSMGLTPASEHVSFIWDISWLSLGPVLFIVWSALMIAGWSNAVNLTDGQDGLATGASVMGACFGFLWWNAAPAKIIMGDTGALALGGAFAGLAICTRTELLALIIGGLFLGELLSVVIQVSSFKLRHGKRVFKITPIHHHFEMMDWPEVNITIRFWIIAGLCVAFGLGVFYGGFEAAK